MGFIKLADIKLALLIMLVALLGIIAIFMGIYLTCVVSPTPSGEMFDNPKVDTSNYSMYYVNISGMPVVGADRHQLKLLNNPNATNATYAKVMEFVLEDRTDEIPFERNVFVCADYSERLHNNAEERGITSGLLSVSYNNKTGHMFNAFPTTDAGVVYVDNTQQDNVVKSFCIGQEIKYYDEDIHMEGNITEIIEYW